ncbi:MAG TPA: hypothetical protein VHK63_05720 [Candidatus Limnocylindria bacterium]|nr:hypothetical protein [Candidatus Limnocylindria bacterium]
MSVAELPDRIAQLSPESRERLDRIFQLDVAEGRTDPPAEMHAWLRRQFGSVQAVERQAVLRVTNRWSLDGSLLSPLRGKRPVEDGRGEAWSRQVEQSRGDPFCDPEHQTPADTWGRVRGRHLVTGANAAMYDSHHGVMIFDEHDPLAYTHEAVVEMLHVGREWAERGRAADAAAVNYLLVWNCGPRAGGSVLHGHAQMLVGRGPHYARVERLRRDAQGYRDATGHDYFADLVACHRDLGLVVAEADGVATMASLTPIKERELLVVGRPGMDERQPSFADAVARLAVAARDALGMRAFNLALHRAPLGDEAASHGAWTEVAPMVHLVDRGDPASTASDIGAMELFAASVVGADPFEIAGQLSAAPASP